MTDTVIDAADGLAILVNVFEVKPDRQQELIDLLDAGTENAMKDKPGFISVNIFASLDGTKVVNLAQWRGPEDVQGVMSDPSAREWAIKAAVIATSAPSLYRVVSVHHA